MITTEITRAIWITKQALVLAFGAGRDDGGGCAHGQPRKLNSTANTAFTVQFFSNPFVTDEGQKFIG
jgi:hypothetical protein